MNLAQKILDFVVLPCSVTSAGPRRGTVDLNSDCSCATWGCIDPQWTRSRFLPEVDDLTSPATERHGVEVDDETAAQREDGVRTLALESRRHQTAARYNALMALLPLEGVFSG
jgi:hypothetical protein